MENQRFRASGILTILSKSFRAPEAFRQICLNRPNPYETNENQRFRASGISTIPSKSFRAPEAFRQICPNRLTPYKTNGKSTFPDLRDLDNAV